MPSLVHARRRDISAEFARGREGRLKYIAENVLEEELGMQGVVLSVQDEFACNKKVLASLPSCNLCFDDIRMEALVDSCAWYIIMNKDKFDNLWPGKELHKSEGSPGSYTGHRIPILGFAWADLEFESRKCHGKVYVADKGVMILGWPQITELGIKVDSRLNPPVYTVHKTMYSGQEPNLIDVE